MGTPNPRRRGRLSRYLEPPDTPPRLFYLGPSSFTSTPQYGAGIYHRFRFVFREHPEKPFLFMLPMQTNPDEPLSMDACHAILRSLWAWCRGVLKRGQWTPAHNLDEAPPLAASAMPETEVPWIVPTQN